MLLLLACAPGVPIESAPALDEAAVAKVLELSRPDAALALLDGVTRRVDQPACPVEAFEDGDGLREVWGACPGGEHLGNVDRYEDPSMAWMEVRRLAVIDQGQAFRMDGALEHLVDEEFATIEMAATLCGSLLGGEGWGDCADPVQVDLSWTILSRYDRDEVLVSGTLATPELGPLEVEGTWTIDLADCESEPVRGLLQLEGERVVAFDFDGPCDGCSAWSVDGASLGDFCE
ncbi:MAG TPA: hypothetical protein QGF58_09830 [Myxococcota bacterium]|nr:hypothetical protein [Myxococcota bacterium]